MANSMSRIAFHDETVFQVSTGALGQAGEETKSL